MRKIVFYIHTKILTKKRWGKNARNNFSRNTRIVGKKVFGKNRPKKCEKRFLYSHQYRDQKKGDKKMHETIFPETHE